MTAVLRNESPAPVTQPSRPASVTDDWTRMDRWAGFGQFSTRVWIDGPNSYRFELAAAGDPVATFFSDGEVAMALFLSDQSVSGALAPERIAELVVAGVNRVGYHTVVLQAQLWQRCGNLERHEVCTNLAYRLSQITASSRAYPRFPQWQPDWRHVIR